jgi:5-methylcytosine-specific restriction endonuclease McrA
MSGATTRTRQRIAERHGLERGSSAVVRCVYCGSRARADWYANDERPYFGGFHLDHVIPTQQGGSNGPENLVIACPPCNLSKHAETPAVWLERRSRKLRLDAFEVAWYLRTAKDRTLARKLLAQVLDAAYLGLSD